MDRGLKTDVILDGIRFLESISRCYGAERGIEIWDKMGDAMGQDVKGEIFFHMLTGETSNRLRFSRGRATEAVATIKIIRMHSGLGLKETKDLWDLSRVQTVTVECTSRGARHTLGRELRDLGLEVL